MPYPRNLICKCTSPLSDRKSPCYYTPPAGAQRPPLSPDPPMPREKGTLDVNSRDQCIRRNTDRSAPVSYNVHFHYTRWDKSPRRLLALVRAAITLPGAAFSEPVHKLLCSCLPELKVQWALVRALSSGEGLLFQSRSIIAFP